MKPADFNKERDALVRSIKKQIKPFLWESGYCKRLFSKDKAMVMLWLPRDASGELTGKTYKLKGGFVLTEFEGFTDEGAITDSYGGGLATASWAGLPIEDLYRLNAWMERKLPDLTGYDRLKKTKAKVSSSTSRSHHLLTPQAAA